MDMLNIEIHTIILYVITIINKYHIYYYVVINFQFFFVCVCVYVELGSVEMIM